MPTQPLVYLYVLALDRLAWPGKLYPEGIVALNSVYPGIEGFFIKTMLVTNLPAMVGGSWLGFPKYIADLTN